MVLLLLLLLMLLLLVLLRLQLRLDVRLRLVSRRLAAERGRRVAARLQQHRRVGALALQLARPATPFSKKTNKQTNKKTSIQWPPKRRWCELFSSFPGGNTRRRNEPKEDEEIEKKRKTMPMRR